MAHWQECKLQAIRTQLGVTEGNLNDLEKQFLLSRGVADGNINEMWIELARTTGYTGFSFNGAMLFLYQDSGVTSNNLNDAQKEFWCGGGTPPAEETLVMNVGTTGTVRGFIATSVGTLTPNTYTGIVINEIAGSVTDGSLGIIFATDVPINVSSITIDGAYTLTKASSTLFVGNSTAYASYLDANIGNDIDVTLAFN